MPTSTYFSPKQAAFYSARVASLRGGTIIRPDHVDIHESRCNARCRDCIGHSGSGTASIGRRVNSDNIARIIDNIHAGYSDDLPNIHFAGFTGDPFFGVRTCCSVAGLSNTAVEGFLHLLRKGMDHAKRTTFVTNGIGLSEYGIRPQGERSYPFVELLQFAGSVQVSLDASSAQQYKEYKQTDMFDHVMGNIRSLAFWGKHARGLDYHDLFDRLGIPDDYRGPSEAMTLEVNYVLHRGNSQIREGFIETLDQMDVDSLRFRTDYFLRDDMDFQSRMHDMVAVLRQKYPGINMGIVMKSPDHPISKDEIKHCVSPFFWPAVGVDGNVYPCAHTVIPGLALGSLFEKTLLEILANYYEVFASGDTADKKCQLFCPSWIGRINMIQTRT